VAASQELFESALKCEPEQRASFLDEACRDESDLRATVESLLCSGEPPSDFMRPPVERATFLAAPERVSGQRFFFVRNRNGFS
jgi:hypothetical protein